MSSSIKCSGCGEEIRAGHRIYWVGYGTEPYCEYCVTEDVLDESFFEDDDSHAIIEERLMNYV